MFFKIQQRKGKTCKREVKTRRGKLDWETECPEGHKLNKKGQQGSREKF